MAWTGIARREHSRAGLRYPSDMTDREWLLTAPFIPPAKTGGRRRSTDMREVVNALLYIAASGCSWRLLPKCFAPVSTVRRYFYTWRDTGLFDAINMVLVMNLREMRAARPRPVAVSSTANRSKPLKVAEFAVMTRARRSRAANGISLLTPAAFWCSSSSTLPTFRIATGPSMSSKSSVIASRGCAMCSPMAAMRATNSGARSRAMEAGRWKSSSDQTPPKASNSCRAAGSSSGRSHGSAAAAASPKTGKGPSPHQQPGR